MTASSSSQSLVGDLVDALHKQAVQAGADAPSVRGSDWRLAVVATVGTDGTIVTSDGITARCMESYLLPTVSDLIVITQSSNRNWLAWGRGSTGTFSVGRTVEKRKTASTSRASTTTLAADPHLVIDVVPGEYRVDAFIMYDADTTADLKLGWFAPASTTGAWWPCGSDSGNTTFAATARWGALSDFSVSTLPVAGIGAGSIMACRPVGTAIVTGTGQISLAWAQNASSATPTIVRGQSTLQLKRIA
ncbi:hypothetical protein ABT010_13525 [Streptomyces sp. NPDC002668]|uniref:hypothetical protein n=1 Tax=Streptomyces sp. NPDC002668 TaxID=3154422 RepID=UPI00331F59CD